MNAMLMMSALVGCPCADPEAPKPISQERIKELVKKLEEPTRHYKDPKEGPPDGAAPHFEYRWHASEIYEFWDAGDAAVPALLRLLEDTSKPGQARAQAAAAVMHRLRGKEPKQELASKIVQALKKALAEKDLALMWGIVDSAKSYGAADWREHFKRIARNTGKPRTEDPATMHFPDSVMDDLLPGIVALVQHEEPEIAATAAYVIFSFGRPKQGVKELLAALERREKKVRASAVAALSRVGQDDPTVLQVVLGQLKPQHYTGGYYVSVIEAVGRFGPKAKDAVPALILVLKDDEARKTYLSVITSMYDSSYLYEAAITALGEIGPDAKSAVPAILERMRDGILFRAESRILEALDKIDPSAAKEARTLKKQKEDEFLKPSKQLQPKP